MATDATFDDLDIERQVIEEAGLEFVRERCRTADDVIAAARGAAALIVQYAPITASVIDALEDLRIVSRYGVGVDNVDVAAATRRQVWVANVPEYGTSEVATHTVALLLGSLRHVTFHDRAVREGMWDVAAPGQIRRLSTLTLGLVGLGRIGRMVAEMAGPWFARVVAFDPMLPDADWPPDVERMREREHVIAASDALSLHLPLTEETRGSIDAAALRHAPPGGIHLVNTARGGLVDLDDLLAALDAGRVRAAALDVLPSEPPPSDHPILHHPRVSITPHAAWYSEEAERDLRRGTAQNIVQWARSGRPRWAVNEPAAPPDGA